MVATVVVVLAALPAVGEPSLLVDIDTSPSRSAQAQLVEANEQGVLYTQFEREGGTALFWSGWEGAPRRVSSVTDGGVKARRLGDGFVIFTGAEVARLEVSSSLQLTSLAAVADLSSFVDTNSTSSVWWAGSEGTFVTDGTPGGTRRFTTANDARVALGTSLFFNGTTLTRMDESGVLVDTGIPLSFGGFTRARDHMVVGGTPVRNELGEDLSSGMGCFAAGGGESAWLRCRTPDGGHELLTSDGTPSGTTTRYAFVDGGVLIDIYAASAEHVVFSGAVSSSRGNFALSRAGSGPPVPFSFCFTPRTIIGDTLISPYAIGPAVGSGCMQIPEVKQARQVGSRALLQLNQEGRFLLTDGTDAGSVSVPAELPDWPTASSEPTLLGSDGLHALYSTTQGVWSTDGTASGTRRVGSSAEFFGHTVLGLEEGRFFAFASNGDSWEPPVGVLGVAGGLLLGRDGCEAFTVDEDRARRSLLAAGCVSEVKVGTDGALLRNTDGVTSLARVEGTFPLVGDVELESGVRCGKKVCWYVTRQDSTHVANVVELESGRSSTLPTILTEDDLQLVVATDAALVVSHSLGTFAMRRDGGRVVMETTQFTEEPALHFGVTTSGSLVWYSAVSGGGVQVLSGRGDSELPLTCSNRLGLKVTGDRVSVLCLTVTATGNEISLLSGTVEDGLEPIAVGNQNEGETPFLPSGDGEVIGFLMMKPFEGTGRFVLTDGKTRREYPGLHGSGMARVRGGYVLAATRDSVPDLELWVLPEQGGCGCGSGGESLLLGVLLLFRRAGRFSGRTGSTGGR